jgi:hypothetical protein
MNGRVYDPEVARFLSADPFVQFPGSTQGYNRYAYVNNNPMSYSDPSGYFLETLQVLAISFSTVQGAKAGGISGAIKGFALAGASAGIANAIGNAFPTSVTNTASAGTATASVTLQIQQGVARQLAKAALHGLTQGALSAAGGGRFGDGFLGAAFSSFMGDHVSSNPALGTLQAAVIGGTVSAIGGGKFANGALSAAFVHAFNHASHLRWPVHQTANAQALGDVFTADEIALLDQATIDMDKNQSGADSYKHAMRNLDANQSAADAMAQADTFVRGKFQEAWSLLDAGDRRGALNAYGQALHTLQDATSPVHAGFQGWKSEWGKNGCLTTACLSHGSAERFYPGNGSALWRITRASYYWFQWRQLPESNVFSGIGHD